MKELTTGAVAAQLNVSPVTVWNMIQRGELTARQDARGWWRVPATEAERVLTGRAESDWLPVYRYPTDTKRKLRDLAEYHGCTLQDVVMGLVQREWQRVIGGNDGMD